MCGFVGLIQRQGERVDGELLNRMRDVISHRGPDDRKSYVQENVGLGFRRLSIIDVEGGAQPLSNEDDSIWVVFNGEIYNFKELRADLVARGHSFKTRSDTECIVHGYEQYGEDIFERLNGMFAVALWDHKKRVLLLARDRAGEKPLHYCELGGSVVFGSEIKSLLIHPAVSCVVDTTALDEFFTYGFISAPRSIYRSVRKLRPGHYLRWTSERGAVEKSFWHIDSAREFAGTYDDAKGELLRLLEDSVSIRMISEVPLGAFLSGGVDSSAVVAMMARSSCKPVKTFSIGFEDQEFDECRYARQVAECYGTEHTELKVTDKYFKEIPAILDNFDEPFGDSSALPTYLVAKLTRQYVTVSLSGDGGDELFGGYDTYRKLLKASAILNPVPSSLLKATAMPSALMNPSTKASRWLKAVGMTEEDRFIWFLSLFKARERESLYSRELAAALGHKNYAFERKHQLLRHGSRDFAWRMQYADLMHYLPDDILVKVDRASMLVSLESRAPFLDHRLIELAFSLPSQWKVTRRETKKILKDALEPLLPRNVLYRRKMGFSVPLKSWFRGALHDQLESALSSREVSRYIDGGHVRRLMSEHRAGKKDHAHQLWQVLAFAAWSRRRNRTCA